MSEITFLKVCKKCGVPERQSFFDCEPTDEVHEFSEIRSLDKKGLWLIWSIEHEGWWKAGWNGYTKFRTEAGVYSYEEAYKIVKGANINDNDVPNEAMIKLYD